VITQPSSSRLIDVIKQELADNVAPMVTDPQARASLQMIDHILGTLAVRADHEIAWMIEEIAALADVGEQVLEVQPDAERVAAALAALRAAPVESLHYDDVAARYSLSGEILSCAFEEVATDSPLRMTVEGLLDARLAHELDIMGTFELVGRS
jgi:hypothetical protein